MHSTSSLLSRQSDCGLLARSRAAVRGKLTRKHRVVQVAADQNGSVPSNVLEARAWIAAWRFKQAPVKSMSEAMALAASFMETHKDGLNSIKAAKAALANAKLEVTISTKKKVHFGQSLKLVGSAPEMGSWDPKAAPKLEWSEGDNWTVTLYLPPGKHEFKRVAWKDKGEPEWEEGPNKSIQVPARLGAKVSIKVE